MNLMVFLVLFSIMAEVPAKYSIVQDVPTLLRLLKRRALENSEEDILDIPESLEDLPLADAIHPGHTLLQPSFKMLKSAVKYPQKQVQALVYGNLDNLGITYGKTRQRVLYTNFRKSNDLLVNILRQAIQNIIDANRYDSNPSVIVISKDPENLNQQRQLSDYSKVEEINDNDSERFESNDDNDYKETGRRKSKSKYRDRDLSSESSNSTEDSSTSQESDYQRNPGNPYTVHKDKYKQNWLWNHFMDGDHMNVNPYAPNFVSVGPSGAALFFGRKWWYYNQDDFKPLN